MAASALAGLIAIGVPDRRVRAWSLGTAYSAFFLLMWGMTIGPLNVIRRRPNPVHNPLRRDVGIAAAIIGLVHTALGLQVHMGGSLVRYFLPPANFNPEAKVFFAANWSGLVSAILLALLMVISNNASLRRFGLAAWKKLQRWAYAAAAIAVAHGLAYQLLEKRAKGVMIVVLVVTLAVLAIQVAGWRVKRESV